MNNRAPHLLKIPGSTPEKNLHTHKVGIDLVGQDGHLVAGGDGQDVEDMVPGEDVPAGVGRAVDHDAGRALVQQ